MNYVTVSGAYGRDYKSAKAAKKDWKDGKDFIIRSVHVSGTYISNRDCKNTTVNIRFWNDRKICVVNT